MSDLTNAARALCWHATPVSAPGSEWVDGYVVSVGTMHKLVAAGGFELRAEPDDDAIGAKLLSTLLAQARADERERCARIVEVWGKAVRTDANQLRHAVTAIRNLGPAEPDVDGDA